MLLMTLLNACGGTGTQTAQPNQDPASEFHSVTLSWTAPTQRSDDTSLPAEEIDGYVIYYGQTANNLTSSAEVTNGATTDYTINNLTSGTWYFNIQTLDIQGQPSSVTTALSVTL